MAREVSFSDCPQCGERIAVAWLVAKNRRWHTRMAFGERYWHRARLYEVVAGNSGRNYARPLPRGRLERGILLFRHLHKPQRFRPKEKKKADADAR